MSGEQIKTTFYAYVLPRIRQAFGEEGKQFRLELTTDDPYDFSGGNLSTTIFHSMHEISSLGVVRAIKKLLNDQILSSKMPYSLNKWADLFLRNVWQTSGNPMLRTILCDTRAYQELFSNWFEIPDSCNC